MATSRKKTTDEDRTEAPKRITRPRSKRADGPSEEQIRTQAYQLAEQDGFRKDPDEYWHDAERQLRAS